MRIFIALDIDDAIRERLQIFIDSVHGLAPDALWVRPESLHVTLKFVGEKAAEAVEQIQQALARIQAGTIEISLRGYGFFPAPKRPRVLWAGIEAGPQLVALAKSVDETTAALGVPKEEYAFSPHITLARKGRSDGPRRRNAVASRRSFQHLQERLAAMPVPEFGTMTARAFFLYQSQPMQGGSRYTKIARFGLG
jgi:2'-5' RNA ligase